MPRLIIGLIGLPGSGKGTVADLLQKEYGANYTRFSGVLSDLLDRLSIEKSRDNMIRLSEALRQTFGDDALSYAVEQDALRAKGQIIVLDGIRRPGDIVGLEMLPQFHLVSVEAAPELRYERMKARGEKATEAAMTWEQFLAEEQAPTEVTIPAVMERAEFRLDNSGTKEELEQKVRELMKQLGV